MATSPVFVTDSGSNNVVVSSSALAGNELALSVRAITSPANAFLTCAQVNVTALATTRISATTSNPDRRLVKLKNGGANTVFLGPSSPVNTGTGSYALFAGESETFEIGPALAIFGLGAVGGPNVTIYVMELA